MIFIVSWCYGGLAMVIFILFWQGSYPPWWHHTGITISRSLAKLRTDVAIEIAFQHLVPLWTYISHEKNPGWLGCIGDYSTHLCGDYFINHDKHPY